VLNTKSGGLISAAALPTVIVKQRESEDSPSFPPLFSLSLVVISISRIIPFVLPVMIVDRTFDNTNPRPLTLTMKVGAHASRRDGQYGQASYKQ
jgi:hypothetical protein